jgi:hypothetical protein
MTRGWLGRIGAAFVLAAALSGRAHAQTPSAAAPASGPWVVIGGGSTSLLSDCTDCENHNYVHTGGLLVDFGRAVNPRFDFGVEFLWVPSKSPGGDYVRTAFVAGAVQFRPWKSKGFFIRGSSGMAFVRNWIITPTITTADARSKAFALGLTAMALKARRGGPLPVRSWMVNLAQPKGRSLVNQQ